MIGSRHVKEILRNLTVATQLPAVGRTHRKRSAVVVKVAETVVFSRRWEKSYKSGRTVEDVRITHCIRSFPCSHLRRWEIGFVNQLWCCEVRAQREVLAHNARGPVY